MKLHHLMERRTDDGMGLAYGDLLLIPTESEFLPREADPSGRFSRRIPLKMPFASAAMSTVTELRMAIAMAMRGGIGVIHPALDAETQLKMVRRVKLHLNARIDVPISLAPDMTLGAVRDMQRDKEYGFETFPVIESNGTLCGLITSKDFGFFPNPETLVREAMTPFEKLACGTPDTSVAQARSIMLEHRVRVVPLIARDRTLVGMYVAADVERVIAPHTDCTLDAQGHLRVAASIGIGDEALARAERLASVGCDAFVVGTAHGDTKTGHDTVRRLATRYPNIDVVAGNTSYGDGAQRLADAGASGILVGQGPGSICTTRVVAGVGMPQASAVFECAQALARQDLDVPVIADGGITASGDIVKAFALGAESVMLGNLLAGTDESPGELKTVNGMPVKVYYGMGSRRAMNEHAASRKRYGLEGVPSGKRTAEGEEGSVPYRGPVAAVIDELVGGVRSGMGYTNSRTLRELRNARAVQVTHAALAESRVHDLIRD